MNRLILTVDELRSYSLISRNTDVNKLIPFIRLATDLYLKPILGDYAIEYIKENDYPNEVIKDKILTTLCLYTDFLAYRHLAYTITEKGITKEKSENSDSLNSVELGQSLNDLKALADASVDILINYINNNKESLTVLFKDEFKGIPNDKFSIYFPKNC